MSEALLTQSAIRNPQSGIPTPRLGFLGVGWIGRNRMEAIAASGAAEVAAICDPSPENAAPALEAAPGAEAAASLDALLEMDLDGLVIATPNALHAEQSVRALEAGVAVFCQKPLARTAAEARRVVDAARAADRLLGVDLSYRHVRGVPALREAIRRGELGRIFAADLTFHNAYGPGKAWCYDLDASGGGCMIDLGVHLVDLALWMLGNPAVVHVERHLFAGGSPLPSPPDRVEDFAVATLTLETGATVRLACSWNLPVGKGAVIEAKFFGTGGGASLRNLDGSFYDLVAERLHGPQAECVAEDRGTWGGRAAAAWAEKLAAGSGFDAEAEALVTLHETLDRIYGRG